MKLAMEEIDVLAMLELLRNDGQMFSCFTMETGMADKALWNIVL